MRIFNDQVIFDSADMSASLQSEPIYLGHIMHYSIQLKYTGSPVGTFKLQVSNDLGEVDAQTRLVQGRAVQTWTDVADSSVAVSGAGDAMWTVENIGYRWARVIYTASSGTGAIVSARANGKGV